jgi:inner membrane protein
MATFLTHPLFGASAAYMVSPSQHGRRKFVLLSTVCQWLPDIDTFTYLFAISDSHALGHRGLAHSLVFAALVALCVVRYWYREVPTLSGRWWTMCGWFFLMTALHGVFDAMVFSPLGVAFLWPFDNTRYLLPWQPLVDVPIAFSALQGLLWYAVLVECQFFGLLLSGLFVVLRVADFFRQPRPTPELTPMPTGSHAVSTGSVTTLTTGDDVCYP